MRLALSGDRVEVVNFLSSASFNVHTVKIDVKEEASNWPRDDIPAAVREPSSDGSVPNINALYLSDGDGRRIRVGVAPSYGGRTAIIVDDLRAAIAKHRSY